ncbi:hypothetical protein [Brevifollis gellanilyticus]|uniref:Uncharacterized protein n=1 Tax=Brevifollis gellanilyticus TaxID=748831 RepID=A0A512M478_9BACT|nr:hypothetical protein [Brevifollis gellanilyticus]GEP41545.1 hypothetical protein BGE01nite_08360 [Brevifollis gellanilyticus]
MTTEESSHQAAPQRLGLGKLLLISFALCSGSIIVDQTIRWSNPLEGFLAGSIFATIVTLSYGSILILPWSFVIWGLYEVFEWKRFRSQWILAPAIAVVLLILAGFFTSPPTARGSFKQFANAKIPADATSLKYHLWGGGYADYAINYYFECSSESVEKLIADMQMEHAGRITAEEMPYLRPIKKLPEGPDYRQWVGGYHYSLERRGWFFDILTDPTKTKVYVWISCI